MNTPEFFRLGIIDQGQTIIISNRVFENHGFSFYKGLTNNHDFINIIFAYIAKYDIDLTEQELINRGFAVVDTSNISQELLQKVPILYCDRAYEKNKKVFDKEDGIRFLDRSLPLMTDSLELFLKRKKTTIL